MDGLEGKLNELLSSPDSMEKVMGLVRSLGLGAGDTPSPADGAGSRDTGTHTQNEPQRPAGGGSPLPFDLGALSSIDPKILSVATRLLKEYSASDDKIALLQALKPHLNSEKQEKVERAAQILRLSHLIKLFGETGGGAENV